MLKPGQELTIYAANSPPGRSRIVGNLDTFLSIELPRDGNRHLLKYKRGTVLKIRLIAQGYSYAFTTKLRRFQVINGFDTMLIDHSTDVQYNQLRKDQRKEANLVANFQLIEIVTTGIGATAAKQAVVRKHKNFGKIEDISKGGCALFSRKPLATGTLIKISFNIGTGEDISAFGKVRSTVTRTSPAGVLMHIVFTRVSRQHMNEIQSYVYNLSKI